MKPRIGQTLASLRSPLLEGRVNMIVKDKSGTRYFLSDGLNKLEVHENQLDEWQIKENVDGKVRNSK